MLTIHFILVDLKQQKAVIAATSEITFLQSHKMN